MVSSGHWRGTLARVRRCRPIWRRPENQRCERKPLTEMNGEPWNTPPAQEEKLQIQDRECIAALKQQNKCGGQKVCMACSGHAGLNPRDLSARTQDIVDNEVVQTDRTSRQENTVQWQHIELKLVAQRWLRVDRAGGQPHDDGCSRGKFNDTINDEFNDSGSGD